MPSIVNVGALSVNNPQQNAGIFLGNTVITGWDANMKFNSGNGGFFGFFNYSIASVNSNFDGFEAADGNMNDQDVKPYCGVNT